MEYIYTLNFEIIIFFELAVFHCIVLIIKHFFRFFLLVANYSNELTGDK
jgi:hypothetical protein